jgi:hypothetical protein
MSGDIRDEDDAGSRRKAGNSAVCVFQFGRSSARFDLQITTSGLLAIGLLVAGILLSIPPIIEAAKRSRP